MTLILTQISKYGIIHASDSNLSSNGKSAGVAKKTFKVPFLKAGLTVAGNYSVDRIRMDIWLTKFIKSQAKINKLTLADFSHNLKTQVENQMKTYEKSNGSIFHIAGYVKNNIAYHPEFWHVTNVHSINMTTGEYGDIRDDFAISEDFWSRDWQKNNLQQIFPSGGYQLYINGFASGRISYVILQSHFSSLMNTIWNNPNWLFRPPKSLVEAEGYVKLFMQFVGTLFKSSNYSAPFIGGRVQTCRILPPK